MRLRLSKREERRLVRLGKQWSQRTRAAIFNLERSTKTGVFA